MNLKYFVGDLFGFTSEINNLNNSLSVSETWVANLSTKLKTVEGRNVSLQSQLELLSKQLEDKKDSLADFWNSKYPVANIEYNGRTFGTSTKMIPIDVRLLVTPQDFHIHEILKANNLYYKSGSIDDQIVKVYHFIKKTYYKYVYDKDNYGITEYWEFPYEVLEALKKKYATGFDCDSWASLIVSFVIASGVPEWKARVVVGNSVAGGHSTCYFHCDKTNKFHHLNSTMGGKSSYLKLEEYPITSDAGEGGKDTLGIYNVWLSYNNLFSWHKFTSQARTDFKEKNGKEFFIIK